MNRTHKAFNVVLGTGLVHLNPPKNHSRALRILDDVLSQDADNVPSLMGRGFIVARAEHWSDAMGLFARVAQLRPDDITTGLRAKEEQGWCQIQLQDFSAQDSLKLLATQLDHMEERHEDQARCWWRLGRCLWMQGMYMRLS
jgi:superkiller protein 3